MNQRLKSTLRYLFFLCIGILLLWLALRGQDLSKIWVKIKQAQFTWVGLAVFAALLSHISRAIRWKMLITPLGYNPKLSNTFWAVMVGYLGNFALPRMGEVMRCGVLARYEKVPLNSLLGTVITERSIDLLGLFVIIIFSLIIEFEVLGGFIYETLLQPFFSDISSQFLQLIIIGCVILGFIGLLILLYSLLLSRLRKWPFFYKFKRLLVGFLSGIKSIRNIHHTGLFIAHTIFIYCMYYLMAYLCFWSFAPTAHLGLGAGLTVLVVGSFGIIAPVQGGIGTYHWLVTEALHNLYHLSWENSLVYAFIVHSAQTIFIIVLGGISLILLPLLANRELENGQVGDHTSETV